MEVAILTNLVDDNPWYSLTSIIKSQCYMLSDYKHKVHLYVSEDYQGNSLGGVSPISSVPYADLTDYKSQVDISPRHLQYAQKILDYLYSKFTNYDVIFTHDLMFTGFNLPFALAIKIFSENHRHIQWYHWVHSKPHTPRDWWDMQEFLGNHTIVYPNHADIPMVKDRFNTESVICVPHIKDITKTLGFSRHTTDIIEYFPSLMKADIVQCYPAATDRFDSKGVRDLLMVFSLLKKRGKSVCLVIINQFSGRRSAKLVDPIVYLEKVARRCGLDPYKDVIFTSEIFNGKYTKGVPENVLRDLMSLNNLFVFPSKSESFGLVLAESSIYSGALPITNASVDAMSEVIGLNYSFDFGDLHLSSFLETENVRFNRLVDMIIDSLDSNPAIQARSNIRRNLNQNTIYNSFYKPILESVCYQSLSHS